MLVIEGKIFTFRGQIPVEKLKVGDLVLDREHSVRKLLSIKKGTTDKVLKFKNNSLIVSADAYIYTAHGAKQLEDNEEVKIRKEDMLMTTDVAYIINEHKEGYELVVEGGTNIFVNGYNVELGGNSDD